MSINLLAMLAQGTPIKLETGDLPSVPAPTWMETALAWSPWIGGGAVIALAGAWALTRIRARRSRRSPEARGLQELAHVIGFSEREVRAIVSMTGSEAAAMAAMVSRSSFRAVSARARPTLEGSTLAAARDAARRAGCPEVFDDPSETGAKLTPTSKRMLEIIRGTFLAHLNKPGRKGRAGRRA